MRSVRLESVLVEIEFLTEIDIGSQLNEGSENVLSVIVDEDV